MPTRRRQRSPSTADDNRAKRARVTNMSSRREAASSFSIKKCESWFHEYVTPNEEEIGPEEMEKFCEDIGVEPENIVMLSLAWKLKANRMGYFTYEEWMNGMKELQCDSTDKLIQKLDYLRSLLDNPVHFKNIYRFSFDFAREKEQRSMDIETAKAMLTLTLGKNWTLFGSFHQFLVQSKYKVINKDQWCNILEFSRSVAPDLSNYDEDGAWPVILDEFVDWLKEQNKMNN